MSVRGAHLIRQDDSSVSPLGDPKVPLPTHRHKPLNAPLQHTQRPKLHAPRIPSLRQQSKRSLITLSRLRCARPRLGTPQPNSPSGVSPGIRVRRVSSALGSPARLYSLLVQSRFITRSSEPGLIAPTAQNLTL
ncbi:unnamed protein product [Boreogadus saida]